jgi:hypothetical protein
VSWITKEGSSTATLLIAVSMDDKMIPSILALQTEMVFANRFSHHRLKQNKEKCFEIPIN